MTENTGEMAISPRKENHLSLPSGNETPLQLMQRFGSSIPTIYSESMTHNIALQTAHTLRRASLFASQGIVSEHAGRNAFSGDLYNPYIGYEKLTPDQIKEKSLLMQQFARGAETGDLSELSPDEQEQLKTYLGYDIRASRRAVDKLGKVITKGMTEIKDVDRDDAQKLALVLRQLTFIAENAGSIQTQEDVTAIKGLMDLSLQQINNNKMFTFDKPLVGRIGEWIKEALHNQELALMYGVLGGNLEDALAYSDSEQISYEDFMKKE